MSTALARPAKPTAAPSPQLRGAVSGALRAAAIGAAAIATVIIAAAVWHIASSTITPESIRAFAAPTSLESQSRSIEQLVEGAR
ncbi:hypothetical protein QWZ10_19815 [Paracoccus cavernae]|uniref:ABC transporter permease n=1 Tax=Paracoccus cavernae TaxID=1571207 RepID=A0ABT8DAW1_9RHOB|nr:hypothetical protein [Paracoccus cavernae]